MKMFFSSTIASPAGERIPLKTSRARSGQSSQKTGATMVSI